MDDCEIVELYWQRCDRAIAESDIKYGSYCMSIAFRICRSSEDAEECVSDTWLHAWNTIPPRRPGILSSFFGSISRNLAIDRWRRNSAAKRGSGETELAFEELSECIPGGGNPAEKAELNELEAAVREFIHALPQKERRTFLARYYFMLPVAEIAQMQHEKPGTTRVSLHRTREKLIAELRREGLC